MSSVYVVIENGEQYPHAYMTYELAQRAVKAKWDEEVKRQEEEGGGHGSSCCEIDLPENPSGTTLLYVEKGINIYVVKLQIICY
jgi:hypothetical protein